MTQGDVGQKVDQIVALLFLLLPFSSAHTRWCCITNLPTDAMVSVFISWSIFFILSPSSFLHVFQNNPICNCAMNMDTVKKRTNEDWLLFSSIGWRIFLAVAGSRTFTSNICNWHICAEQSLLVSFQSHNSLPILDWTGRDLGKGSQLAFSASRRCAR